MFKKPKITPVQAKPADPVKDMLASPAYRTIRAAIARKMLDDPMFVGVVRVNDDPDGPLLLRTDDAAKSGEQPRWYEVTTEEAWPYLVAKHEPRYGKGAGLVVEIPLA